MRVFLAGATGAIGRPLLRMLQEAGHEVTAMTRSDSKTEMLRSLGARPVVCDAFDADALRRAVGEAGPEVIVDQLTDIPQDLDVRRYGEQMAGNDRIRRETTPTIMQAAVEAGTRRVVAQSVAFAYAPQGPPVLTEDAPLDVDAPAPWDRAIDALTVLEEAVTGTPGVEGVVLRYGFFYGPGTSYASDGGIAGRVRARKFPIVGKGDGVTSFIHVEDAAEATAAACERGEPGIYNIVDDEPAPLREWLPAYAEALGAKRPFRVPVWVARMAGGPVAARISVGRGASNAKARRELGWEPRHRSWRQGFREALG